MEFLRSFLKVMIRNDDFQRNTASQHWNNVNTIRNNVTAVLQRLVALKIVITSFRGHTIDGDTKHWLFFRLTYPNINTETYSNISFIVCLPDTITSPTLH